MTFELTTINTGLLFIGFIFGLFLLYKVWKKKDIMKTYAPIAGLLVGVTLFAWFIFPVLAGTNVWLIAILGLLTYFLVGATTVYSIATVFKLIAQKLNL